MGLQIWPPSEPPLYSMACLDVETPTFCRGTFKSVLQLCLQQRRSREQLVEQGIMPPLKMPAAFHEQIRNLERARTGNFLKHKICNRPERSELVRMHILQETQAEPSLQATQMKLKRARLADDLNEKIALRPGPMELVVKNILPVDTDVKDTKIDDHEPKMHDVYNFDEDSNDSQSAISAEQPSKPAAQQSSSASPRADSISSSPCVKPAALESPEVPQFSTGLPNFGSTKEKQNNHLADTALQPISNVAPNVRGPLLIKQSQPKTGSEKSRSKKTRDPKPRVKKLKYHQYVPPDQKQDPNEVPMDTAYVRLLEQQQQFLQLQILTQQQHHYSCQAIPPTPLRLGKEGENSCSNVALRGNNLSALHAAFTTPDGPAHSNRTQDMSDHFPSNLDDMKVAELKMELKLRGLLVSGTKNDLIDRLRCYQVKCKSQPVTTLELSSTTTAPQSESIKSTPPVSPVAFEVSGLGLDDSGVTDSQTKLPETLIPAHGAISGGSPAQEERHGAGRNWDKDRRLHEKERQIEELRRQLEREQRLVEELKMQLESEKRGHQEETPPSVPIQVKEEGGVSSHRPPYCSSPDPPLEVEQNRSPDQKHQSSPQQLFLTHQQLPQALKQTQSLRPGRPDAQALQSASLTASAVTIKLPENRQHTTITSVAAGILQAHGSSSPKTESSEAQQCNSPSSVTQSSPPGTSPGSSSQMRETQSQADEDTPKHLLNTAPVSRCPASTFTIHPIPKVPVHNPTMMLISKCKDPPRYEDAVKQTRCRQTAMQVPTAVSQHMDDLFDVLIESGEIAPFMRQDSSCLDKLIPVTANVTTLPINTVLSRPPAQIQVAQPPDHTLDSSPTLMASVAINQMEVRVEGTLHKHLLEHSQVDTMEVDFSGNTPLSTVHLQNANLDNMDWLDLTIPLPVPEEAMTHLEMSAAAGVFSSEFLESPDFQLNWE